MSGMPERDRIFRGTPLCGKAGVLCKSAGRRRLRPGSPRQPFQGTAGGGGAGPAGRTAPSAVRHLLHGVGHRRRRRGAGAAGGLPQNHFQHHAAAGPGRAQSGAGQRNAHVSAHRLGGRILRHDRPGGQAGGRGTGPAAQDVPGRAGPAPGVHGLGGGIQRGGRAGNP